MDLGTDLNIHGAHGVKPVFDQIEKADFARGKLDSEQLLDAIVDRLEAVTLLKNNERTNNKRVLVLLDRLKHR